VTGYELQLIDISDTETANLGVCSCTSLALTNLDTTKTYQLSVAAMDQAGPSLTATSSSFTPNAVDPAPVCAADDPACTQQDVSCAFVTCVADAGDSESDYDTSYIGDDGSTVDVNSGTGAIAFTRPSDGSAGDASTLAYEGALQSSAPTSDSPIVTPLTPTPRGYKLHGGDPIDRYHWRSQFAEMVVYKTIRGKRILVGAINERLLESINGGSSRLWDMQMYTSYVGGDPYTFYYHYYCGVNVPHQTDWTCNTHESNADPSYDDTPISESVGTETESLWRSFGSGEHQYAKFPMVEYRLSYRDGGRTVYETLLHRGWDVHWGSHGWEMAEDSGTGD
jgi:hypothetical protein